MSSYRHWIKAYRHIEFLDPHGEVPHDSIWELLSLEAFELVWLAEHLDYLQEVLALQHEKRPTTDVIDESSGYMFDNANFEVAEMPAEHPSLYYDVTGEETAVTQLTTTPSTPGQTTQCTYTIQSTPSSDPEEEEGGSSSEDENSENKDNGPSEVEET